MYKYVVIHHNHVIQIGKKFTDVSSDIPTFTSQYSVYIKHGVWLSLFLKFHNQKIQTVYSVKSFIKTQPMASAHHFRLLKPLNFENLLQLMTR
jgi:hypothetical protein